MCSFVCSMFQVLVKEKKKRFWQLNFSHGPNKVDLPFQYNPHFSVSELKNLFWNCGIHPLLRNKQAYINGPLKVFRLHRLVKKKNWKSLTLQLQKRRSSAFPAPRRAKMSGPPTAERDSASHGARSGCEGCARHLRGWLWRTTPPHAWKRRLGDDVVSLAVWFWPAHERREGLLVKLCGGKKKGERWLNSKFWKKNTAREKRGRKVEASI